MAGGDDTEIAELLTATAQESPVESIDMVTRDLAWRCGASAASFLIVDLTGKALVRVSAVGPAGQNGEAEQNREAERVELHGSVYDQVVRAQRPLHETLPDTGMLRLILPVTNRGDPIGLLELTLPPDPGEQVLASLRETARVLAYIVIADQRFTDLYTWGKRTARLTLPAEIQHQLLPPSMSCEVAEFALSGALEPSGEISGDTFDYALDRDCLHLSVTDPMGHDIDAALLATVLVGALRGARRAGASLEEQARQAHRSLCVYGRGHATGQLLRIGLREGTADFVNAGHPLPLRLRGGTVEEIGCEADPPFGFPFPHDYRVQRLDLRSGDRLVLLTDGMLERGAESVDMPAMVEHTRTLHPREAVRVLTNAVEEASGGRLQDDATVICLDWYGPRAGRPPYTAA